MLVTRCWIPGKYHDTPCLSRIGVYLVSGIKDLVSGNDKLNYCKPIKCYISFECETGANNLL